VSAPPRSAAISAIGVLALACGLALGGCGGSAKVSDVVPKSPPEITPPEGHTAENASAKKTHVTAVGSATTTSAEAGHHESGEGSSPSSEGATGGSTGESASGSTESGGGGGTAASGTESGGKSASEGTNGGASAP
jgi:hypothetical protein